MRGAKLTLSALMATLVLLVAVSAVQARLVTDEMGHKVQIPDNPKRIIGLTPSLTEILFALGVGDKVVGATMWADYPDAAAELPRVGSYVDLNLEKIVDLSPDLVLANKEGNPAWAVKKLAALGVPVYVTVPSDPADLPANIAKLGDVCGAPQAGRALASQMQAKFDEVAERLKGVEPRPTLVVLENRPLVSVGKGTMNHRLLEMAGAKNIAADTNQRWPRLSLEYVLQAKPQVVLLSTMERGQNLEMNMAYWKSLPGVGDRPGVRVESISSDIIDRPGPRVGQGLEKLARLIHPERFSEAEKKP